MSMEKLVATGKVQVSVSSSALTINNSRVYVQGGHIPLPKYMHNILIITPGLLGQNYWARITGPEYWDNDDNCVLRIIMH